MKIADEYTHQIRKHKLVPRVVHSEFRNGHWIIAAINENGTMDVVTLDRYYNKVHEHTSIVSAAKVVEAKPKIYRVNKEKEIIT